MCATSTRCTNAMVCSTRSPFSLRYQTDSNLGPIVRIAPEEVSLADVSAAKEIYKVSLSQSRRNRQQLSDNFHLNRWEAGITKVNGSYTLTCVVLTAWK